MKPLLVVAVMLMGLATATGSLWVTEHHSIDHQVTSMRQYHGLPAIPEDAELTDLATEHSWRMARSLTLFHSTEPQMAQAPQPWETVGEIVGRGTQIWLVVRAFMDSPEHRELLLGDWSSIGYGHVRGGGQVWVTVWFRR
jgi:uncharacterized protein YkwD